MVQESGDVTELGLLGVYYSHYWALLLIYPIIMQSREKDSS
jgi:hypothetical protein